MAKIYHYRMRSIGERVRYRRTEIGLSQQGLADLTGYSQSAIDKIEHDGTVEPGKLIPLARGLRTPADWLYDETGPAPMSPDEAALLNKYQAESPEKKRAFLVMFDIDPETLADSSRRQPESDRPFAKRRS